MLHLPSHRRSSASAHANSARKVTNKDISYDNGVKSSFIPAAQVPALQDKKKRCFKWMERVNFEKLKLFLVHFSLWSAVVIYLVAGAAAFHLLEKNSSPRNDPRFAETLQELVDLKQKILVGNGTEEDMAELLRRLEFETKVRRVSAADIVEETTSNVERQEEWSFTSALLFTFTLITTIGYGNVTPSTAYGKLLCIFYGLVGIPLTMLAIADLGKFIVDGISEGGNVYESVETPAPHLGWRKARVKIFRKPPKEDEEGALGVWGSIFLIAIFLCYVLATALVVPLWEEFNFFDGIYFSFITLTTVGFGDIVPSKTNYLPITLIFLTIGLALTTMTIEVAAETFKKLHYLGAKLQNVKRSVIWFGGKKLTVGELLVSVGKKYGISAADLDDLNLEEVVGVAIEERAGKYRIPPNKPVEPEDFPALRENNAEDIAFVDDHSSNDDSFLPMI